MIYKILIIVKDIVIYIPFFILNHISFRTILPKKYRRKIDFLRTKFIALLGAKIGKNVFISKNFFTTNFKNISFGNNGTLGMNCQFYSYGEGISIGDNFLIGSNFVVHTSEHIFKDTSKPIIEQGCAYKPVIIGNNVYIGSGVTVLSGVTIGDNIIVGTGSIVTKNLDGGAIYAGNPAKKIKDLDI